MPAAPLPHGRDAHAGPREALRRHLLAQRRARDPQEAERQSRAAQERLLGAPCWREAGSVALFVGVRDEIRTDLLLRAAWASGRELWLPRVRRGQKGLMDFVRCQGPEDLAPGSFGLVEPRPEHGGSGPGDTAFRPGLILVPGLAFDRHGNRMGYGGGYYDRFLAGLAQSGRTSIPAIGFCFGFQLVETVPCAPWDRPVDGICTEGGLFWTSR